nr:PREDICTED: leukotriene A-4 hydrolase [Latimeria chalumnae]|eukprot:XP_014343641.1 PREDICTED: leukotriene A-4 hydrolase [Latimeria chalumnae]
MADPNSFSSFSQCTTKHLNLQLQVDFESRVVKGTVALTVEALKDQLSSLILDTKDLKIFKVVVDGKEVNFSLGTKHAFNGTPLEITLPFALERGQHVIVRITYETSPTAFALQWLTPEQTAGKKHPYLFSQCQVSVPSELVVAMSAKRDGERPDPQDNTRKIYRFRQTVPMPCYLIAIVVGALESRVIGPRTRVWSEKEYIDQAAFEFSETETMLKVAEDLAGPYVWGQYDLLVLPPSFPYGGMENPCLTFVTPTLLAGDKSLSNVIAHEISHSWTGNLVTNQTWEHFWYAYSKRYDTTLADACITLCQRWSKATESDLSSFTAADLEKMSSHQKVEFLALLLLEVGVKIVVLGPRLATHLRFFDSYVVRSNTSEQFPKCQAPHFRWLRLCIRARWEEAIPLAVQMATEQGRMKFTRPLFRDLYNFDKSRELAVSTFLKHRSCMHPVTALLVGKDLGIDPKQATAS